VDADYWVQQLRRPVRFSDGVRRVTEDPGSVLLEVGPGRTLSSLAKQHRDRLTPQAVVTSLGPEPERDVESLLEAAGRLWIAGIALDWSGLHGGEARRRVPLPTYPFERTRFWLDPAPMTAAPAPERSRTAEVPAVTPAREEPFPNAAEPGAPRPDPALTEMEAIVAGVWRDLLGLSSVDVHDNFFDLGGDSLLALRVVAAIEKQTGRQLPSQAILVQTLAELALSLEACTPQASPSEESVTEPSPPETPLETRGIAAGLRQTLQGLGLRLRRGAS
jgi:acyl transferase domain-containing protein